jgi:3-isopropylmalate dehydrogenase
MNATIVSLPGDGIGPEVMQAALSVLEAIGARYEHRFAVQERLIGGHAIDETGTALPDETLAACRQADAILLGAVGGPKWDDPAATVRPEQGLLGLRSALTLFANLRPVLPHPALVPASPLRPERLEGVDLLVVRELTAGIYFGRPRERRQGPQGEQAIDTMSYHESEVRRVAHVAFRAAQGRRRRVTSVDKANVLETSRLWRQIVTAVADEYPDVTLEHLLVDAATMHLLTRPATFDVIVTTNMFGDILTDEASVLAGSLGTLPSASLGESRNRHNLPLGLFEPIHGSAPDIAGQGVANPLGMLSSLALLLRYSLGLEAEAEALEGAIARALTDGGRTADLAGPHEQALSTEAMTAMVAARL